MELGVVFAGYISVAFLIAYLNCRFAVKFYTLLSTRYNPFSIKGVVYYVLLLFDMVLKAAFFSPLSELLFPPGIAMLSAILSTLYFSRPLNYQLALEVMSGPSFSLSKNLRENLTHLLRWLRVGVDVSSRAVGFPSLLTSLVALFVN